jgi:hypothetical protein
MDLDGSSFRLENLRQDMTRGLRRFSALWPFVVLPLSALLGFFIVIVQRNTALDATSLSIIAGFGAGVAIFVQKTIAERRQYTINLLIAFSTNRMLAPADRWMAEKIAEGHSVKPNQMSVTECGYLVTLLDYYEFLCLLLREEMLDRRVFIAVRFNAMRLAFAASHEYIIERRVLTGWPGLYMNIESVIGSNGRFHDAPNLRQGKK